MSNEIAKGTLLLGIKAVIAESFERIHRSNLVGMGVLPLVFKNGMTKDTLKLDGSETFDVLGLEKGIKPRMDMDVVISLAWIKSFELTSEDIKLRLPAIRRVAKATL